MDASTFETKATETLDYLMDSIENALGDQLDIDLEGGILNIELDVGGVYIINKHAPNKQIWMSSPVSGASHFDLNDNGEWVSTRGEGRLFDILTDELKAKTGVTLHLG